MDSMQSIASITNIINPNYSQSTKPTIMQINKAKKYGEFVEITAPVEGTASEEYPNVLGGEIWYN